MFVFAPLAIWSSVNCPLLRRVLEWRPLVELGKRSLSVYLWHFPVQCLIEVCNLYLGLGLNFSSRKFFFLYAVLVVLVSEGSYRLIERNQNRFWAALERRRA